MYSSTTYPIFRAKQVCDESELNRDTACDADADAYAYDDEHQACNHPKKSQQIGRELGELVYQR
jgi:hypothetical protein